MGGQQIANVGRLVIQRDQPPAIPARPLRTAVILLATVLIVIWALLTLVDIRKEL